jgi:hypothetical protein
MYICGLSKGKVLLRLLEVLNDHATLEDENSKIYIKNILCAQVVFS